MEGNGDEWLDPLNTHAELYRHHLVGCSFCSGNLRHGFDSSMGFTKDQKHTLSETSLGILSDAESAIEVAFIPTDLPPQEMELADAIRDALSDYRAKARCRLASSSSTH